IYWDLAATEKTEFNDPDWTVGIKLGRDRKAAIGSWTWCADAQPGRRREIAARHRDARWKRLRIGFGLMIRGKLVRSRPFTCSARSAASPWRRPRRVATS